MLNIEKYKQDIWTKSTLSSWEGMHGADLGEGAYKVYRTRRGSLMDDELKGTEILDWLLDEYQDTKKLLEEKDIAFLKTQMKDMKEDDRFKRVNYIQRITRKDMQGREETSTLAISYTATDSYGRSRECNVMCSRCEYLFKNLTAMRKYTPYELGVYLG